MGRRLNLRSRLLLRPWIFESRFSAAISSSDISSGHVASSGRSQPPREVFERLAQDFNLATLRGNGGGTIEPAVSQDLRPSFASEQGQNLGFTVTHR
jgi:hypothetical protein